MISIQLRTISSIDSIFKKGSSLPVAVTSDPNQKYFVKLKGTGEGTIALISDFVSSKIGTQLSLPVLEPFLIQLNKDAKVNFKNDELYDLINNSYGINLGFPLLENTRDYSDQYYSELLDQNTKDLIFLFDCFLLNIDRTLQNHDIIVHENKVRVLDYGASFLIRGIIHNIEYEKTPEIAGQLKRHIFYRSGVDPNELYECFSLLPSNNFNEIIDSIPDEWIQSLNSDQVNIKKDLKEKLISRIQDKEYLISLLKLITEREIESDEKIKERHTKNREDFENKYLRRKY